MYNLLSKIRSRLLVFLTHNMALPMLRFVRKPELFPYSMNDLSNFGKGTVGRGLYDFIDDKNLELLPHYAKHDIKHILLGYDSTEDGEVCLQCFMLGNGHLSFPVLATILFGVVTMPEYYSKFWSAYKRGKSCSPISGWDWAELVPKNTCDLQLLMNQNYTE